MATVINSTNWEEQQGPTILQPFVPETRGTPRQMDRDSAMYSAATGEDFETTTQQVESGVDSPLRMQADAVHRENNLVTVQNALEDEEQDINVVVQGLLEEGRQMEQFRRFLPESLSAAIRNNVPGATERALDRLTRVSLTVERAAQRVEEVGTFSTVVDFGETLIDPLSLWYSADYRRLTRRYEALLNPGVSMEEFSEGLDSILDDAMSVGLLSSENVFLFQDFLTTLGYGTESGQQDVQEYLGVLDLGLTSATEVLPAAMRLTRGVRAASTLRNTTALITGTRARSVLSTFQDAGRDVLSAISLMRPSPRNTDLAEAIIQRHVTFDDVGSAATVLPAHSHMSFATPTLLRGSLMSAPVHTAVRRFEQRSEELDHITEAITRVGAVFDEETFVRFAQDFSVGRRAQLEEEGARGIIDVEVGIDNFSNPFVLDVIGRVNGQHFASETTAMRAAAYGDEPFEVAPGQWVLLRRHNFSADDLEQARALGYGGDLRGLQLYRATDPEQLGEGFWAMFGSSGAQADPAMGSYLHRSANVFTDALHVANRRTLELTRGMPRRDITRAYEVFDHMATLPRRDAFTLQEFDAWYFAKYNAEPTDQQRAFYLLTQERLDAELFVTAQSFYERAVEFGYVNLRHVDTEYIVRPVSADTLPQSARIFDDSAPGNGLISPNETAGRQVYQTVGDTNFPNNVQYFVSSEPQTRALRHSDFMPRNAGGHRAYVTNQMQYLLKQRNIHTYMDGTERELSPRTLLGARTPEEARLAMGDINAIIDDIIDELNPGRMSEADFDRLLTANANNPRLNTTVAINNGFNVRIADFSDLIAFARERGISLRRRFEVVSEGSPMDAFIEGSADLRAYAFAFRNGTHADDVRANILRGGRGSTPLVRYGGLDNVDLRPTQSVLENSYISAIARATEHAYRVRNFYGILRAAQEAGVLKADYGAIQHLPIRTQIERILRDNLIDTTGAKGAEAHIGPRLRLDLQRLQFRLQQTSFTTRKFREFYRGVANFFYGQGWTRATNVVDRFSRDPSSALRGWAFDNYLGFFNWSQLLMQGSQVINIMGIAGTTGVKGTALAPALRFLVANGHPDVLDRVAHLLHGVSGLTKADWENLVTMFRESGRHITTNNVAELSIAEDSMSNFGRFGVNRFVRQFRESGRVFYKEGELAARTSAFVTSYLEYIAKHGGISGPRDRRAIQYITKREQTLTQFMGAESRQGFEQLPFMQFMTYNLRIAEAILAGTVGGGRRVLTAEEKVRLAGVHLAVWGAAASAPTAFLAQYIVNNYDVPLPETAVRGLTSGALDAIVSWITGTDTAISARFASGTGWAEMIRSYTESGVWATLAGPSGELAVETGRVTLSTIYNAISGIATGNFVPVQDNLIELARFTSTGNYTYNAYSALRYGEYLSKRGSLVTEDLSTMDAVFLLFGIPLEEIQSIYQYQGNRRFITGWLDATVVPRLNTLYEHMNTAARRDDIERLQAYANQIAIIENSLSPWERRIVDARVNPDFRSMSNSLLLEIHTRGVEAMERID